MNTGPDIITFGDIDFNSEDFNITIGEVHNHIPFAVERIYWLRSGKMKLTRGNHAHMNSYQVLIVLHGTVSIKLSGQKEEILQFELCADNKGLFIPPKHWMAIEMSAHCILLCISSHLFNNQSTIYNYEDFIKQC